MLRENRFPSLEVLIDRISHLSFSLFLPHLAPCSLSLSFSLFLSPVEPPFPSLFRLHADCLLRLSLGVAPLLRFTFAMSLPVRSGRGKSVTQERSEAIGCDRTRVKERNRARARQGFTRDLHCASLVTARSQGRVTKRQ